MKKYFFGYLFVRLAKLIAILTVLVGIGFALFRLEQANLAAQSASYQPSQPLQQGLAQLAGTLTTSQQLVSDFSEQNGGSKLTFPPVELGDVPQKNSDFTGLDDAFSKANRQRQQLKDALVTRFEAMVGTIQAKLRAHAAEVAASTSPVADGAASPASTPRNTATPAPTSPTSPEQAETLYTGQMTNFDIEQRTSALARGKELLKVLEAASENPASRQTLADSVGQLDALAHLLPEKIETPITVAEPPPSPATPAEPIPSAPRRELNAEKVADQLSRLRGQVRQTILTSWALDAAYARASELAAIERERCRLASLSVKGIWVAAFGQSGLALLASVFAAFLVLVLADFMQTLLDTATNTGVLATSATSARH